MIGRVSSKGFRRVTCTIIPKFWSGVPFALKKSQKPGFGMSGTYIQSPEETKLKVIETSNMA